MYPQRSLQQGTARRQGHSEVVQEKGVHKQENLVILKRLAPTTKSRASGSRSCGAAQKLSLKATKTRRKEAKARRSKASNGGVQCPDRDRLRCHCRRTSKSVCQRAVFT